MRKGNFIHVRKKVFPAATCTMCVQQVPSFVTNYTQIGEEIEKRA
jgi:hypothetical protein